MPNLKSFQLAVSILLLLLAAPILRAQEETAEVDFIRDIRPILSNRCFQCHGPDEGSRETDFRFDDAESATGEDGEQPIVPGDPDASLLIERVSLDTDDDRLMPPAHSHKARLSPKEIETFRRWIKAGAKFEGHWAFQPIKKPNVATVPIQWGTGPIDTMLFDQMGRHGLKPSPPAERVKLIRRVTLDLTGLPPTPLEVDAFVNDPSPDAYDKIVDRLLQSPRYGEHMARYWLDAVRYGDTHGLHLDNYREIWPYRDQVIAAFNKNMDWANFTTKQIAGDLLPNPTTEDLVLSGYNRLHVTTNEGGTIKEEAYVRNVVDRISTTGTVYLGLSIGCAQCHDHKFDPILASDFYSMFAIFNNLDADPMDGNKKDYAPVMRVPTEQQALELESLNQQLAELNNDVQRILATVDYSEPEFNDVEREEVVWINDEFPPNAETAASKKTYGPAVFVDSKESNSDNELPAAHSGKKFLKRTAEGRSQDYFTVSENGLRVGAGDTLFAYVYLDPNDTPEQIMLQWHTGGWKNRAYWGADQIDWGTDGTGSRQRMGDLPPAGQWVRLEVNVERIGIPAGSIIDGWAFTQFGGTVGWDQAGLFTATPQGPTDSVWIDDNAPEGANLTGDGPQNWQWVSGPDHPVHSGQRSLRRQHGDGLNQDVATGAAEPLVLSAGDQLFAYVYLDPKNPPKSVQLQFNDGKWEHRARWGQPAHGAGQKGGADYVASKTVPATGQWVRLEVPIEKVGLKPGDSVARQRY